jgi:hypothetical protein
MTLSDLSSFVSVISGLAVLGSLVYLAQQNRQNVKHTRALIQQGRVERIVNVALMMADPELVAAWIVGNDSEPTPEAIKQLQFTLECRAYLNSWDDSVLQYHQGLLSEEQFNRFCGQVSSLVSASPGLRRFLTQGRFIGQNNNLQKFVDKMLADSEALGR